MSRPSNTTLLTSARSMKTFAPCLRLPVQLFGCVLVTWFSISEYRHVSLIRSVRLFAPSPPMGPVAATSSVALRFPIFIGNMGSQDSSPPIASNLWLPSAARCPAFGGGGNCEAFPSSARTL
jgi:hypothetical protein